MADPAVTAVIPCFNHGQFVERAVDSVLGQTYGDVRIIVVDDGSTDSHTIKVLQALDRPRTVVLRKQNDHVAAARNSGIRMTSSRYILTLDADDYFEPQFLQMAVAVLDEEDTVGVVTCCVRSSGCRTDTYNPKGGGTSDFLMRNCSRASALFRRQCWERVGGYNETMKKGYEDWDFWISITAHGWSVHCLPGVLLNYRCGSQSMVTGADALRPELVRQLVRNHLELYRDHVADVVYAKECHIQSLERRLDELRGSTAYRIGRCFTEPMTALAVTFGKVIRSRHAV
jgi:GT2 family glycosyltransferase